MAVSARWYAKGAQHFMGGDIDWTAADKKVALHLVAYTPNTETDEFQSVLGNEHAAAGTYVAGGIALTTIAEAIIDDAAVTAWTATTAYLVGDIVRPTVADGFIQRCIVAGTSSGTEPASWGQTVGLDTIDATVTWENVGTQYVRLDGTDIQWAASTITDARFAVVYVDGTDGVGDFVIGFVDFGQDESSVAGDFDINWHLTGILHAFISL